MTMTVTAFIMLGASALLAFLGVRSFQEKGFLFNNSYLYATKEAREKMNKTPFYRQSGACFLGVSLICFLNALQAFFGWGWLLKVVIALCVILVIYAIVSTIVIEKTVKNKMD